MHGTGSGGASEVFPVASVQLGMTENGAQVPLLLSCTGHSEVGGVECFRGFACCLFVQQGIKQKRSSGSVASVSRDGVKR